MNYLQESQKVLEHKAFRYSVKKSARFSGSLGTMGEDVDGMKDVFAVVGDQNYADLITRDREIRAEPVWNSYKRVKLMSDIKHVEFK